jgi:hypothetical protein
MEAHIRRERPYADLVLASDITAAKIEAKAIDEAERAKRHAEEFEDTAAELEDEGEL